MWLAEHIQNPENFPLTLNPGEWDDQSRAYESTPLKLEDEILTELDAKENNKIRWPPIHPDWLIPDKIYPAARVFKREMMGKFDWTPQESDEMRVNGRIVKKRKQSLLSRGLLARRHVDGRM